jgi:hypothetical protein
MAFTELANKVRPKDHIDVLAVVACERERMIGNWSEIALRKQLAGG